MVEHTTVTRSGLRRLVVDIALVREPAEGRIEGRLHQLWPCGVAGSDCGVAGAPWGESCWFVVLPRHARCTEFVRSELDRAGVKDDLSVSNDERVRAERDLAAGIRHVPGDERVLAVDDERVEREHR